MSLLLIAPLHIAQGIIAETYEEQLCAFMEGKFFSHISVQDPPRETGIQTTFEFLSELYIYLAQVGMAMLTQGPQAAPLIAAWSILLKTHAYAT